jgi:glycosyltransferase involved in cell wall biosynthesis
MRILLWTDPFWPSIGGVERLVVPMVRTLAAHGHQLLIVTNQQKSPVAQEIDLNGSRIVRLPMLEALDKRNPAEILDVQTRIATLIRDFRPDVFHLFAAMLSAYFYARNYRRVRPVGSAWPLRIRSSAKSWIPPTGIRHVPFPAPKPSEVCFRKPPTECPSS